MAIKPTANSPQAAFLSEADRSLVDPVTFELLTKAVTLQCGHNLNEDTAIRLLATTKLCPKDRKEIISYTPNYDIRSLAEKATEEALKDNTPSSEAQEAFNKGKQLVDQEKYAEAVGYLMRAIELSPSYEKAHAFLDFCLKSTSHPPAAAPPAQVLSQINSSSSPLFKNKSKQDYIDLLLSLLEEPPIQKHTSLKKIFALHVEELMNQESEELTPAQIENYKWTKMLYIDRKIRQFVADKLEQIHAKNFPQIERHEVPSLYFSAASSHPQLLSSQISAPFPSAISSSHSAAPPFEPKLEVKLFANPEVPSMAFGKKLWNDYLGDIGVEPPLPPDIDKILKSPCPFFPGKRVEETHLLTLIPKTVNGKFFTLNSLEELVKQPKHGYRTKYKYYWDGIKKEYGTKPLQNSYWVLMTKDIIPGSRGKTMEKKAELSKVSYEMPKLIEAATSILLEYLRTGKQWYTSDPETCTWCQERTSQCLLVVGNFDKDGLVVSTRGLRRDGSDVIDHYGDGLGCVRRF